MFLVKHKPIQLVVPMSGQGERFKAAGFSSPKPMISINSKTIIERLLESFPMEWPKFFVLAENHRSSDLPEHLKKLDPFSNIQFISPHKQGPARALLASLEHLQDGPVFVSYCDYGMIWDSNAFTEMVRRTGCDAAVVCYKGFHPHYLDRDHYAYCRMSGDRVVEIREKGSFTADYKTEFASAGGYYFKDVQTLERALRYQYKNHLLIGGEYYTSLTVQALLAENAHSQVRVFEIPYFFQWGTPRHLKQYEYWERAYQHKKKSPIEVDQLLMPMAGFGSRFSATSKLPKPLIDVEGEPMFRRAASAFDAKANSVFVTRQDLKPMIESLGQIKDREGWVFLNRTPPGQALSTEAGLYCLDPDKDVIVTACDHEILVSPETFERFRETRSDAAIFTVRGYPGADRKPQAFAYVLSENESDVDFQRVKSISVKKPLSEKPSQDALLVGTFWFRSAALLAQAIEWLKTSNLRVNGELYLDSVFEQMIERGLQVREIPIDSYICWGDPDSLDEAQYWSRAFQTEATHHENTPTV